LKAALVKKRNKIKMVDIPVRKPEDREVLIRVDACGFCGSDYIEALSWARNWKRFGHEIAGTVVATGSDVIDISVEDKVVVALSVACGECVACIAGNPRKCTSPIIAEQGGFAEFLLIKDYKLLVKVKKEIPAEMACLSEPLSVVLDAFHLTALCKDDNLLVVGGGNIGNLAVLAALALNVNVIGILSRNIHEDILKYIKKTGGDHFPWRTIAGYTLSAPLSLRDRLSDVPGRIVVLHTAPVSCIPRYIDTLPYDSTIVNIGLSASPLQNRVLLNASKMIFKRIQFMNAFPVPCIYMDEAVNLIQDNSSQFSHLPITRYFLDQLPSLFQLPRSLGKVIICNQ